MKLIIYMAVVLNMSVLGIYGCNAQKNNKVRATETFQVWGNCEMCEMNIESAAKLKGVSKADWNRETHVMTVTFDTARVTLPDIQKAIAAIGYDNDGYRGDDDAYSKLPECCHYKRREQ